MKKWMTMMLAVLMLLTMTACQAELPTESQTDPNGELYNEYAIALLDTNFHGVYKDYIDLTGASEENAKLRYENTVDALIESLKQYYLLETKDENVMMDLEWIAETMYKMTKYSAAEAIYNETTQLYTVKVSVEPLAFLKDVEEEVEAYVDDINRRMTDREFEDMTDEEYELMYAKGLVEILEKNVEKSTYGKAIYVDIAFSYDSSNKTTYVTDSELEKVAKKLILY